MAPGVTSAAPARSRSASHSAAEVSGGASQTTRSMRFGSPKKDLLWKVRPGERAKKGSGAPQRDQEAGRAARAGSGEMGIVTWWWSRVRRACGPSPGRRAWVTRWRVGATCSRLRWTRSAPARPSWLESFTTIRFKNGPLAPRSFGFGPTTCKVDGRSRASRFSREGRNRRSPRSLVMAGSARRRRWEDRGRDGPPWRVRTPGPSPARRPDLGIRLRSACHRGETDAPGDPAPPRFVGSRGRFG
jgi:hypothetical protein